MADVELRIGDVSGLSEFETDPMRKDLRSKQPTNNGYSRSMPAAHVYDAYLFNNRESRGNVTSEAPAGLPRAVARPFDIQVQGSDLMLS